MLEREVRLVAMVPDRRERAPRAVGLAFLDLWQQSDGDDAVASGAECPPKPLASQPARFCVAGDELRSGTRALAVITGLASCAGPGAVGLLCYRAARWRVHTVRNADALAIVIVGGARFRGPVGTITCVRFPGPIGTITCARYRRFPVTITRVLAGALADAQVCLPFLVGLDGWASVRRDDHGSPPMAPLPPVGGNAPGRWPPLPPLGGRAEGGGAGPRHLFSLARRVQAPYELCRLVTSSAETRCWSVLAGPTGGCATRRGGRQCRPDDLNRRPAPRSPRARGPLSPTNPASASTSFHSASGMAAGEDRGSGA